MKNNHSLAQIYSEAFFAVLKKTPNKIDNFIQDCAVLKAFFQKKPLVLTILKTMPKSEQKNLFAEIAEKQIASLWKNFFYVLIDDQQLFLLSYVLSSLQKKLETSIGLQRGEVFSVLKLTEQQMDKLNQLFRKLLNKKILLENKIDMQLIGGLRVEIDSLSWDNSIFQQLSNLRQELLK